MTVYLFSDVFKTFKRFFNVESMNDSHTFLYDCAFGFMPRKFEPTAEDKIIYDEEEEVHRSSSARDPPSWAPMLVGIRHL